MLLNSDKILIIGGTGFIGRNLAERCLKHTPHVTCLGLTKHSFKEAYLPEIELLQADICDKGVLRSVLSGRQFDYIFNLGGYINHTLYFSEGRSVIEAHLTGLMNLIDCVDREKLKGFVQTGSSDEYGGSPAPQKETMREMPISPYSFAKAGASHFMQMLYHTEGFPVTVLRFFLVYGPGQDEKRFLPQIIAGCLKNSEFKTSEGKQLRDFCYINDVVDAMIKSAVSPLSKGHIINIASGMPVSIKEVIGRIIELTGGGKPLWGTYPYRKGENMALYADISLAKKILSWTPSISLDEGLQRTIEYYKKMVNPKNAIGRR